MLGVGRTTSAASRGAQAQRAAVPARVQRRMQRLVARAAEDEEVAAGERDTRGRENARLLNVATLFPSARRRCRARAPSGPLNAAGDG